MNEMRPFRGLQGAGLQSRPWRFALRMFIVLLAVLAVATALLFSADSWRQFGSDAPPVERLTVERTILSSSGIELLVRAGGSEPLAIAQVLIDDAYWQFSQEPTGPVPRGNSVWIRIPYPWVQGEAHHVKVITRTGTTFSHEIAVAVSTPTQSASSLISLAIVGAFVGIVPVAFGLALFPLLRHVSSDGVIFLLAVTLGLLAFLMVDTTAEALELASGTAAIFQGESMVIFAAAGSFLLLLAVGRQGRQPTGVTLASFIALGIGLHNFGEGLAIGAALASGAIGLGTFLIVGFTLHNVTEGIGIAAPMLKASPPLQLFPALTLLAGGPAILGIWMGSFAIAPQWSAVALAVGAGAILQVLIELCLYLANVDKRGWAVLASPLVIAGIISGVAIMYLTAMFVKI